MTPLEIVLAVLVVLVISRAARVGLACIGWLIRRSRTMQGAGTAPSQVWSTLLMAVANNFRSCSDSFVRESNGVIIGSP
jgi:hypothetical protein